MIATHPDALRAAERTVVELRRTRLAPPPKLTVSEWADRYRQLSRESAAEPGQWRTERAPYLREIMDAASDPRVQKIVMQKPRRVGGTEAINNIVGYFMHQDPAPIMLVQPTVELAEGWSKEHLAPMVRDTPVLRGLVQDARSRDSGNTVLQKLYPGGRITITGANSGAGFRMRTARVVAGDEIDAWPDSAGTEGDPVDLLVGRTDTFHNRKVILCSTALLRGASRIETAYLESDQRKFYVPCLACGAEHVPSFKTHIRYADLNGPHFLCTACGVLLPESEKFRMVRRGRWKAGRPFDGTAGFQWSAFVSLFDGARWDRLVDMWRKAQHDATRLQVWTNQIEGETYEDREGVTAISRREAYRAAVPAGVGLLTCGADVHADRIDVVVRGWGEGEESWLIESTSLPGDTAGSRVWEDLDAYLLKDWAHESGQTMRVHTTCIDSGFQTEMVYRFCKPRFARRVYATKGSSIAGKALVNRKPSKENKLRCRVFSVGTDTAKDLIYGRLRVPIPGPLSWHFSEKTDDEYFDQLTAERRVKKQVMGRWVSRYEALPNRENHRLDCEVGNVVAFALSNVSREKVKDLVPALPKAETPPPLPEPAPETYTATDPGPGAETVKPQRARRTVRRGGWVNQW